MTRPLYEWAGGTPRDHEALAWFSSATPEQMGPLLARFRGGITAGTWTKAGLCGLASGIAVAILVLVVAPGAPVLPAVLGGFFAVLVVLSATFGALLAARRYRYDVHVHGLVLTGLRGRDDVIPWATLDPGRVFIGRSIRAMTRMPIALHRQRATFPPGVVINGWTNRPTGTADVIEAFSAGYRYQPTASDSPFGWWQIGVTDPGALLRAVEHAMVADGYPATGLASLALGRAYTARDLRRDPSIQRERGLTDPVLGLTTCR